MSSEETEPTILDGFIVVDIVLEDWQINELGFETIYPNEQRAQEAILTQIHPAYWEFYEVREVSHGDLVEKG